MYKSIFINLEVFLIFISRLAEAEAVLVGDDDSPLGGSQGITIEKVTSEFGDTSAFALQVSIWALVQYFPPLIPKI